MASEHEIVVSASTEMICPGCGASVSVVDKVCEYCGRKLTFVSTSFKVIRKETFKQSSKFLETYRNVLKDSPDNPIVLASLGYVLLDRGQYHEAADTLENAIRHGSNDSDVLFHVALARFKSQKPFQIKLREASSIISTIDSAIAMSPVPQYFYAKSKLIKLLFEQRFLRYPESSAQSLEQADQAGLSEADRVDMDSLFSAV